MAKPKNPYFTPKYSSTGLTWGDAVDSHISGYDITPFNGDFNAWARQFTDPNFRQQFATAEEGQQQLNALPSLTSLSKAGYFKQFGDLTPAQSEWLGYNIAREQEATDDHGAADLSVLSVLAPAFGFGMFGPTEGAATAATAAEGATAAAAAPTASASAAGTVSGGLTVSNAVNALSLGVGVAGLLNRPGSVPGTDDSGAAATPTPEPMPTRNDSATRTARRQAAARQRQRRGRASTILTPFGMDEGKLGG